MIYALQELSHLAGTIETMRIFVIITALTGCLFLGACGDADKLPKNVLSREKMSQILTDMNLADGYGNDMSIDAAMGAPLPDSVRAAKVKVLFKQVLDLHQLTPKEFMFSYKFYESHPDKLKQVYELMMKDISARKAEAERYDVTLHPVPRRLENLFPHADSALIYTRFDTIKPFLKRSGAH